MNYAVILPRDRRVSMTPFLPWGCFAVVESQLAGG